MTDLNHLFVSGQPLLDVRAPTEFAKGAFPTATNIPILDDEQRHQVGLCYQQDGPAAAERLGHELVDKDDLVSRWSTYLESHPNALLYCFRGGKRSQITQQWLREGGISIERIEGGYKHLRQFLLTALASPPEVVLLSGKTGVGKTELLPQIINSVDLEGLANHRGSAFGKQSSPQPAQIDFENALAIELLRHPQFVVLEDESRLIGRINVPVEIQEKMKQAPICLLEDSLENRVNRIRKEYVDLPLTNTTSAELKSSLMNSLNAIKNRLGGVRHRELIGLLESAFVDSANPLRDAHHQWIELLLVEYYDPMYEYQLNKKKDRVEKVLKWQDVRPDDYLDLWPNAVQVL